MTEQQTSLAVSLTGHLPEEGTFEGRGWKAEKVFTLPVRSAVRQWAEAHPDEAEAILEACKKAGLTAPRAATAMAVIALRDAILPDASLPNAWAAIGSAVGLSATGTRAAFNSGTGNHGAKGSVATRNAQGTLTTRKGQRQQGEQTVAYRHIGGGYYERVSGEGPDRVRGKGNLPEDAELAG